MRDKNPPAIHTPEGIHNRSELDQKIIDDLETTVAKLRKENAAHSDRWPRMTQEANELKERLQESYRSRQQWEYWYHNCAKANALFAEAVGEGTERIVRENVELRRKLKDVGRNYGKASQTIHDLRAELAFLRINPRTDAHTITELREQVNNLKVMLADQRKRASRNWEVRSVLKELVGEIRKGGNSDA